MEVGPDYCMTRETLRQAHQKAVSQGLTPLAVSASACTTSTGAYDPLEVAADFCEEHALWLHVDGAHGAPVLLSERYKDRSRHSSGRLRGLGPAQDDGHAR